MNRAYPDDVQVMANLAVAYRRTGRLDDAVQLYRRVKTLDPTLAQRLYDEELKGVATPESAWAEPHGRHNEKRHPKVAFFHRASCRAPKRRRHSLPR